MTNYVVDTIKLWRIIFNNLPCPLYLDFSVESTFFNIIKRRYNDLSLKKHKQNSITDLKIQASRLYYYSIKHQMIIIFLNLYVIIEVCNSNFENINIGTHVILLDFMMYIFFFFGTDSHYIFMCNLIFKKSSKVNGYVVSRGFGRILIGFGNQ